MLTASCLKSLSINHMPYLNNKPHVKIIEALVKILGDLAGIMTTQCNWVANKETQTEVFKMVFFKALNLSSIHTWIYFLFPLCFTKSQFMSVKNRVNKHLDGHCRLYNNNGKDKVNIVTFIYNEASCFGKRMVLYSSGRVRCLLLCVWVLCRVIIVAKFKFNSVW